MIDELCQPTAVVERYLPALLKPLYDAQGLYKARRKCATPLYAARSV